MKWQPFNLNDYVRVKIKQKGYEHLSTKHNEISVWSKGFVKNKTPLDFLKSADKDGYTEMQAHEFIEQFGGLGMGLDQYIDINIFIGDRYK